MSAMVRFVILLIVLIAVGRFADSYVRHGAGYVSPLFPFGQPGGIVLCVLIFYLAFRSGLRRAGDEADLRASLLVPPSMNAAGGSRAASTTAVGGPPPTTPTANTAGAGSLFAGLLRGVLAVAFFGGAAYVFYGLLPNWGMRWSEWQEPWASIMGAISFFACVLAGFIGAVLVPKK
jgi:hypothetical protein